MKHTLLLFATALHPGVQSLTPTGVVIKKHQQHFEEFLQLIK